VLRHAAPTLGEHTHEVLTGLLGLSDDEITHYALAGALG
jgi:crotonobetainyl-CoA:carnitine CoA-transferase CaiB-like acyl-CoA transferase